MSFSRSCQSGIFKFALNVLKRCYMYRSKQGDMLLISTGERCYHSVILSFFSSLLFFLLFFLLISYFSPSHSANHFLYVSLSSPSVLIQYGITFVCLHNHWKKQFCLVWKCFNKQTTKESLPVSAYMSIISPSVPLPYFPLPSYDHPSFLSTSSCHPLHHPISFLLFTSSMSSFIHLCLSPSPPHPSLHSCCLAALIHADISPLLCQQCSSTV